MKKIFILLLSLSLFLVGCGSNGEEKVDSEKTDSSENTELETIKVASHTNPMVDMLELVREDLEEKGYELEIVSVSDNVQANIALNNKEVDANFFQHEPFMEQFNKGNDGELVKVTPVYNALVAFYSKDYDDIKDIKENAVVAIPNDPTNKARALRLLSKGGLIELKNENSYEVDLEDIKDNPLNLEFKEWGLLNLNEAYQESDLTFNYPTYIEALELTPEEDGLILESETDQVFAITVAARKDNIDSEKIKALKEVMTGDKIREFIETNLKGHAKVAF